MTEYQILNMFWMQAISNAMFQLGVFVLLWAALRGSLRIYDQGANLFTKIISSLLSAKIINKDDATKSLSATGSRNFPCSDIKFIFLAIKPSK